MGDIELQLSETDSHDATAFGLAPEDWAALSPEAQLRLERANFRMSMMAKSLRSVQEQLDILERESGMDVLCNTLNRRGFMRELERALAFRARYGHDAALVFVDLNDFKLINDHHGHVIGDKVLETVAVRLSRNLRASDLIGRYGGDEFVILLWGAQGEVARTTADKIRHTIGDAPILTENGPCDLSISIGVTDVRDGDTIADLLDRADKAMYCDKASQKAFSAS